MLSSALQSDGLRVECSCFRVAAAHWVGAILRESQRFQMSLRAREARVQLERFVDGLSRFWDAIQVIQNHRQREMCLRKVRRCLDRFLHVWERLVISTTARLNGA